MKFTTLEIAIHKCKQHAGNPVWCGHLTPSDIFVLVESGAKPVHDYQLEFYKYCMDKGDSSCHWFYFFPNGLKMNKDIKKCRKHLTK